MQESRLLNATKFILDFYFGEISYETIKSFTPKNEDVFNVASSVEVFESFNMGVLTRDIAATEIQSHFLPCIVFNEVAEPIILLKQNNEHALLYDPITKEEKKVLKKEMKEYKRALLIFKEPKNAQQAMENETKSWFIDPLKAFYKSYAEIAVLTLFINIFALAVPLFTMSVYDRVVPNKAYETLFVLAVGVGIILIFDIILKFARNHILEKISKRLGLHWEEELMRKILLVQPEYDVHMTGTKANLFKELQQVRDFFASKSLAQVIDFPFFFVALLVIYLISPAVAAVPASIALIILFFNIAMQVPISNLSKQHVDNMQSKHNYIIESIQGSESIKLSNGVPNRLFDWRSVVAFSDGIGMKIQSLNAFSMSISQTVVQLVTVLVIVVGVFEISDQSLTIGGLIAVTILSSRAMIPVINLSMMAIRFKEIKESISRIDSFWKLPIETENNTEAGLGHIKGDIEFKEVTYFFKDTSYPSVSDISFKIKPGEKVGIIGQTGAGKSTLLKLLTGLNKAGSGSIYIDGHDINTLHPVELRQNIGVMPQEPFLFNGTLKENIELTRPISKEKMMELIRITGLDELVKKSGKGDGLQVGEQGSHLSAGQRRLVALARALLNDPSVLILDEPTTGLDVGLENKLIKHLSKIVETDKTLLVITHRFAALELVDRVIVLNEGKVVADGPRDKILQALQGKKV